MTSSKNPIVEALRRKQIFGPDAQRDPPMLHALMDRARYIHENPSRFNENYFVALMEDLNEAQKCLDAVWAAVVDPPKLAKAPRPPRNPKRWVR